MAERVTPQVGTGMSPTWETQASAGYSSVLNEARLLSEPRKDAMSCGASRFVTVTFFYLLETHNSMW